jgi:hypothetical protein
MAVTVNGRRIASVRDSSHRRDMGGFINMTGKDKNNIRACTASWILRLERKGEWNNLK